MAKYVCNDFKDIAKCFSQLHTHIDDEVDKLKVRQDEIEKRVDLVENLAQFTNEEVTAIHNKHIPDLESKLEYEKNERLKLEIWGRKWNLVVKGVPGAPNVREWPKVTDVLLRGFLTETLNMDKEIAKSMLFTAVHRLPSGPVEKRNIIVRLSNLIDRDEILRAAQKELRAGSGYSVMPDLPPAVAVRRGELLKQRSQMPPEEKRKVKLVYLKESPFVKLVEKR